MTLHRSKIINDPVHGFIEIPYGIILSVIDHPAFQRLRRIRQLGLSTFVYPGAMHTRFLHALGAMHLMRQTLDVFRNKQIPISDAEYEAAMCAILLHDIGHGPFSHGLEHEIIRNLHHEDMSIALMHYLNQVFEGKLTLAIEIFEGTYPRHFFHQLVSGQLDMDRMDYLMRDSFFTGVVEGVVGADRIIKTLNVYEDKLVVESKGILSVENFIVARRLMYWQVYLHKAALSAEKMMVMILRRARILVEKGESIFLGETLGYFFHHLVDKNSLDAEVLQKFILLDDSDITYALKQWQFSHDKVLATLCKQLLNRQLIKVQLQNEPFSPEIVAEKKQAFCQKTGFSLEEAAYFVFAGKVSNQAYDKGSDEPILIWYKNNEIKDLVQASDMQNVHALSQEVVKYYICG